MIKTPTIEQAQRITVIAREVAVSFKPDVFAWNGHKAEAYALIKSLGGKTPSKPCFSCWLKAIDFLRVSIGLPPIDRGVPQERFEQRMTICTACPAFHASTRSCGRPVLDHFSPKPVEILGNMVNPCGCLLDLKATMKHATCPAGRW